MSKHMIRDTVFQEHNFWFYIYISKLNALSNAAQYRLNQENGYFGPTLRLQRTVYLTSYDAASGSEI